MSAHMRGWTYVEGSAPQTWRCELTWCVLEVSRAYGEQGGHDGGWWTWIIKLSGGHIIERGEEEGKQVAMSMAAATFAAACMMEIADVEKLTAKATATAADVRRGGRPR